VIFLAKRIKENLLVPYISILFMVMSFFLQPFGDFISGYGRILTSESILLTDYVVVGGIGPTLFNSGSLMFLSYLLIRKLGLKVNGSIFAGILTIGGFAFFGKNLINVSIIYFGVYLYAKYRRIKLKTVIVVFLFSTGISPLSSVIMFGSGLEYIISIPLGIVLGVFSGFLLVELSSHVITFHRGYDLYNVGFAGGILAFAYFSIFKLFNIEYTTNLIYTNSQHTLLLVMFVGICLVYTFIGLYLNGFSLHGYNKIIKLSGKAVTDFTRKDKQPMALFNIGVTGLASLGMLMILNVHINGPVFGGLFTILGFAAFGKHLRNVLPPMIGVVFVTTLFGIELSVPVVLAVIFSTGLAPIAGDYGIIVGILAGMLHLPIALSLSQLHGGVLLYSNGFAAAFTAVIVTTIIQTFRRRELKWLYTKR
jgi:hypothetical protein